MKNLFFYVLAAGAFILVSPTVMQQKTTTA